MVLCFVSLFPLSIAHNLFCRRKKKRTTQQQVLLATGPAVDILVKSGVASYLEFKDMQALYLGSDLIAPAPATLSSRREGAKNSASRSYIHTGTPSTSSSSLTAPSTEKNNAGARIFGTSTPTKTSTMTTATAGAAAAAVPTEKASEKKKPSIPDQPVAATTHGGNVGVGVRLTLSRVPCSKADVFGTKLLTPLEKRRLMKFLLFASDWGLQRAGEDVLARNEAGLGRGRSLRRPQNRQAASGDFDATAHAGKPFRVFLESCGLPERVRAMITHALALLSGSCGSGVAEEGARDVGADESSLGEPTTEDGLEAVCRCVVFGLLPYYCCLVISVCVCARALQARPLFE